MKENKLREQESSSEHLTRKRNNKHADLTKRNPHTFENRKAKFDQKI